MIVSSTVHIVTDLIEGNCQVMLHYILQAHLINLLFTIVYSLSVEEKKEKTLNNIMSAKTKIRYEISELNERLKKSKEEIAKFKDEIGKLEGGGEYVDL